MQMDNEIQYLPITICGEDVIIDYHKRELIFPNRQEDNSTDFEKTAKISIYLKEEGFLDFEPAPKGLVFDGGDLPANLEPSQGNPPVPALEKMEMANVSFTKTVGLTRTLIGLDWGSTAANGRKTGDFALDSLGKVEAFGTEREKGLYGWVIYQGFRGKVDAKVALRNSIHQQADGPGKE